MVRTIFCVAAMLYGLCYALFAFSKKDLGRLIASALLIMVSCLAFV